MPRKINTKETKTKGNRNTKEKKELFFSKSQKMFR